MRITVTLICSIWSDPEITTNNLDALIPFFNQHNTPLVIFARKFRNEDKEEKNNEVVDKIMALASENKITITLVESGYSSTKNWHDAAAFAGTDIIFNHLNIKKTENWSGTCEELHFFSDGILATGGKINSKSYKKYIEYLKRESKEGGCAIGNARHDRNHYRDDYHTTNDFKIRLAKLVGKYVRVTMPSTSSTIDADKMGCVENILQTIEIARNSGVLPGGGSSLIHAARQLKALDCPEKESFGVAVVRRALSQPLHWLSTNVGNEPTAVIEKVSTGEMPYGYDVKTGNYSDMVEAGVLDPVETCICSIEKAAAVASFMLRIATIVGTVTGESDISDHDLGHMARR